MAKKKTTPAISNDGWTNILTGLGALDKDKRQGMRARRGFMSYNALTDLYTTDDLAGRIVDLPAKEEFREGFEIKVEEQEDVAEMMEAACDDLRVSDMLQKARTWERLYGGAVIFMGVADGATNTELPLDLSKVQSVDYLTVFDCSEVRVVAWYNNPLDAKYGEPKLFEIQPRSFGAAASKLTQKVHASRVLYFGGVQSNRENLALGNGTAVGFGDSILLRPYEIIRDYAAVWAASGVLIQDFSQAVYRIKGLAAMLQSADDDSVIKKMQLTELMRSTMRAVMLDSDGEDFERKSTPITGLPEMMDRYAVRVAGAAGIPQTVLFGQAPAGLGATGDADVRFFYDSVKATQRKYLQPQLERLLRVMFSAKKGPTKGVEPEQWSVCWNPLWQMSDNEKADIRVKLSQVDTAYLNAGVVSTEDVARSRFGGDSLGMDLTVDMTDLMQREGDEAIAEARQIEQAKAQLAVPAAETDPKE
jgi:phage-related protein (TIGR01555 family)